MAGALLDCRTKMYLVSSQDLGQSWTLERTIEIERDMREPYFLEVNGTLFFYYFEAGTNPIKFEPGYLQRIEYLGVPGGEDRFHGDGWMRYHYM